MSLKKCIAITLITGSLFSASFAEATPTMTQAVTIPQELMNPNDNPNYVLVWTHLGSKYYVDLSSIVVKQNDDKMRWWAENVVELKNNEYVAQFPREYCYDKTTKNTRQWNYNIGRWENINPFDTNTRVQFEVRAYNLGYLFAFQGGNPIEK